VLKFQISYSLVLFDPLLLSPAGKKMLKKNLIESQKESKLMEKMGTAEPNFEQLFEEKKRVRNPLVPVGKYSINPPLPSPFLSLFIFYTSITRC
jgi:hypothetical protein